MRQKETIMLKHLSDAELSELECMLVKADKNDGWGSRLPMIVEHGYDVKFSYHAIRLLNEVEQILTTGDLDLESGREQLKAIRRGEWTMQQVIDYFELKEKQLEQAYTDSKLPYSPDESAIKDLLMNCIESHYGSIGSVPSDDKLTKALLDINNIVQNAIN